MSVHPLPPLPSPTERARIIDELAPDRHTARRLRAVAAPVAAADRIRLADLLFAVCGRVERVTTTETEYDAVNAAYEWVAAVTVVGPPELDGDGSVGDEHGDDAEALRALHLSALITLARRNVEDGRLTDCLALVARARKLTRAMGDVEGTAECDLLAGRCSTLAGEHSTALKFLARAHATLAELGLTEQAALADHYWAGAWLAADDPTRAEEHLLRARAATALLELHGRCAAVERSLGRLYDGNGDTEQAIEAWVRAGEAFTRAGQHAEAAECELQIGHLHRAQIPPKPIFGLPNPLDGIARAQDAYVRAEHGYAALRLGDQAAQCRRYHDDLLDLDGLLPD